MTAQELSKLLEGTILIAGIAAIFFAVFKDKTTRAIIEQQRELISAQKDRLDLLEQQHIENARAIGELQGEVNAYKKIPLEKIAKSIEQIAKTNQAIYKAVTQES